jgi:uncharacterized protein DUF6083
MTLCGACHQAAPGHPNREPVLLGEVLAATADVVTHAARTSVEVPDPRDPGATFCTVCGAEAEWHRTVNGRWILIQPRTWPDRAVPVGKRWRIAGDGTAVNLGAASPSGSCRISHFDVCPSRPAPVDSPVLLALWRRNAQRVT